MEGFLVFKIVCYVTELRVAVRVIGEILGPGLCFQCVDVMAVDVAILRDFVFIRLEDVILLVIVQLVLIATKT